jgi:SCY1-like protein 2
MLSDKKYGLSVNLMATRVMPSLLPQTVNPSLNLEQFTNLLEVLQEMLDHIDRYIGTASLPLCCNGPRPDKASL